jgi:hypothetical protein
MLEFVKQVCNMATKYFIPKFEYQLQLLTFTYTT